MNIRTKICVQKGQLEHHNVSNYYFYYQKVVPFVAKIAFFCFIWTSAGQNYTLNFVDATCKSENRPTSENTRFGTRKFRWMKHLKLFDAFALVSWYGDQWVIPFHSFDAHQDRLTLGEVHLGRSTDGLARPTEKATEQKNISRSTRASSDPQECFQKPHSMKILWAILFFSNRQLFEKKRPLLSLTHAWTPLCALWFFGRPFFVACICLFSFIRSELTWKRSKAGAQCQILKRAVLRADFLTRLSELFRHETLHPIRHKIGK